MTNCSISFDKPKQTKETAQQERKAPTLSEISRVSADKRSEFPPAFPTANKVKEEIKRMIADGKTKADIEAKFQADYPHKSCYCCCIKPYQKYSHKPYGPYGCPIFKSLITSYPTSSNISSKGRSSINILVGQSCSVKPKKKKSNRTRTKQVPSSTTPIRMCYDTGTSPKSICSKREYFRELVLFESPKFIALAEQDSLAEVIGQGMLDIIINNSYRMWIFAYLTAKSDALLSTVDHLSYSGCTIAGANGNIKISYPTFNYDVSGSENIKFNILPEKSSNKPVLWKPNPEARVRESTSKEMVKLQRLCQDVTLQQNATDQSSGYNVSSSSMVEVAPRTTIKVPLSFAMSFLSHLQCELRPRSSLSLQGINIAIGTIDLDYRGELQAVVSNPTAKSFTINIGQRIGQLIFSHIVHPTFDEVSLLQHSQRGTGGFGSTGTKQLGTSKKAKVPLFQPSLATILEHPKQVHLSKSYAGATKPVIPTANLISSTPPPTICLKLSILTPRQMWKTYMNHLFKKKLMMMLLLSSCYPCIKKGPLTL